MPTKPPLATATRQRHAKVGQHLAVTSKKPQSHQQRRQANYKIDSYNMP